MDFLNNLIFGLSIALTFENLFYCFVGVFVGTLIGVIPGFGPLGAMAILLPFTYGFDSPVTALIFLSGIYYGSQYGGSTTSILLNMPGEIASVVTALDGHKMTNKGRSGAALTLAALSSFIAGSIAIFLVASFSESMSNISFIFGSAEYASLLFLGLIVSSSITKNTLVSGISMTLLGMLFGFVGTDLITGTERFTFNQAELVDGFGLVIIIMSFFGLSEIIYQLSCKTVKIKPITSLMPTQTEIKESVAPCARGTMIGSIFGLIPGSGSILASFAAYWTEKKLNKKVGTGHVSGVVSPEAANNAAAQTSFIPMLSLGLPITPTQALLLAVLIIHNVVPGPQLIENNQEIFWGLIVSMWVGNLLLLILNIPLVSIWVKILSIPKNLLFVIIVLGCIIGAYSFRNNIFDVFLIVPFTLLGLFFKYLQWDTIPLAMGFVVGRLFEEHFKRAILLADGNIFTFFDRPLSLTILLISATIVIVKIIIDRKSYGK